MPPWTALLGGRAPYAPLPSSPSTSSLPLASSHATRSRRPYRLIVLVATAAVTLAVFGSFSIVPEVELAAAVATAKQGVVQAAGAAWRWDSASELQELADEATELEAVDVLMPSQEGGLREGEASLDDAADVELTTQDDAVAQADVNDEADPEWKETAMGGVECSASIKEQVGSAAFWAVTEMAPLTYSIAARGPLGANVPSMCLSQAVLSARLLSLDADDALEDTDALTLVALDRPHLAEDLASYVLVIPPDLVVPPGRYQLDVQLNFGFYVGVLEGEPCGEGATACDEQALGAAEGEQLRFIGAPLEVMSGKIVQLGQDTPADLPLCTDLSSLDGYWSSLSYYPTASPCMLTTPTLPIPFLAAPRAPPTAPLWVHIVGDSNSRNMFNHLTASFGGGRKVLAAKVVDSPTHNGTHATVAFRYREGAAPQDGGAMPDLVVTWMWWYQTSPNARVLEQLDGQQRAARLAAKVATNRDELVSLVDTDLASFLAASRMSSALKQSRALASIAGTVRPHRTYLSLGSHGEQLSLAGVSASLDALFSESAGLSRAARDRANLRLFTTTLVNPRHIPLARFPHQDLVRNNALIAAKNAFATQHPALGGEGRVIDVEALARGVVDSDAWMKPTRKGADAVHFRDEVYDEWVRLVWTDLMQGVEPVLDAQEESVEETRRRWKRRLEWAESLEEDEEEGDVYGF